jgi:hypothetical protein
MKPITSVEHHDGKTIGLHDDIWEIAIAAATASMSPQLAAGKYFRDQAKLIDFFGRGIIMDNAHHLSEQLLRQEGLIDQQNAKEARQIGGCRDDRPMATSKEHLAACMGRKVPRVGCRDGLRVQGSQGQDALRRRPQLLHRLQSQTDRCGAGEPAATRRCNSVSMDMISLSA